MSRMEQDRREDQEFSFRSIEFEMSIRHTDKDVEKEIGD